MAHVAENTASHKEQRDQMLREYLRQENALASFLFTLCEDWYVVEEALQETAVFVCDRWNEFEPGTDSGAWLRTVARMRCREVLRRLKRGSAEQIEERLQRAGLIPDAEWNSAPVVEARHGAALQLCLQALPLAQRELVERHYSREESADRLARNLSKSVDAIYMTLSRIRKRLRECVERRLRRDANV
ncbi:MAG TPA: sigma factor [Planctomycetota bacterium]|nr:sigma factor [Planctomycetota bacterium]